MLTAWSVFQFPFCFSCILYKLPFPWIPPPPGWITGRWSMWLSHSYCGFCAAQAGMERGSTQLASRQMELFLGSFCFPSCAAAFFWTGLGSLWPDLPVWFPMQLSLMRMSCLLLMLNFMSILAVVIGVLSSGHVSWLMSTQTSVLLFWLGDDS